MLNYKLKIGLVPERRYLPGPKRTGIFNPDYAKANKDRVLAYLKAHFTDPDVEFLDLEWLNDEGLLVETKDCERVEKYFREQGVDAIFIINCNFGNEDAAGKIAQLMQVPVLLWGPRDRIFEADGTRYTDSQCGLFAISKQLKRYNLPFTYIENCDIEDAAFSEGLNSFLSVATMVKNFRKLRVVQVGTRLRPFKSVMANELELLEKFGIDVVTVNMAEALDSLNRIYKEQRGELEQLAAGYKAKVDVGDIDEEELLKCMAFVLYYQEVDEAHQASIISTECWTAMQLGFGAMPCIAMSILADMGVYVICESDVYGAVTSALLSCAARGKTPPFFGEFTCRNPQNDNSELLWHCGPFAYSLKKPGVQAGLYNKRPSYQLDDGAYTIARFQGEKGRYYLFSGEFETTEGPYTFGTYLWAQFNDWPKVERQIIDGAYIHHMSEVKGRYARELREFCKYVPGLISDPLADH